MRVIFDYRDVPALVLVDAHQQADMLPGGVSVPVGLVNDLQRAQHALDQAEVAVAKYLAEHDTLDAWPSMKPLLDPAHRGRFGTVET